MKRILAGILISLLLVPNVHAEAHKTLAFNGYNWIAISAKSSDEVDVTMASITKRYYLMGLYDAFTITGNIKVLSYLPVMDWDSMIMALDQFYADYKNQNIYILFALTIIKKQLDGTSKDYIDKLLENARAVASKSNTTLEELLSQ